MSLGADGISSNARAGRQGLVLPLFVFLVFVFLVVFLVLRVVFEGFLDPGLVVILIGISRTLRIAFRIFFALELVLFEIAAFLEVVVFRINQAADECRLFGRVFLFPIEIKGEIRRFVALFRSARGFPPAFSGLEKLLAFCAFEDLVGA
jgi:hypothetical protein